MTNRGMCVLFSSSVELESDNVCMYVCLSGNFGAAWRLVYLFLGQIPGGFFFIFQKFSFLGIGDEAKTFVQPGDFKNLFSNYTIGTSSHLKVTEVEPSAVRTFDSTLYRRTIWKMIFKSLRIWQRKMTRPKKLP